MEQARGLDREIGFRRTLRQRPTKAVSCAMPDSIDLEEFFTRIKAFVGWTEADAAWMVRAWPIVEPAVAAAVDDFYENIQRFEFTAAVITGGATQVERLKRTLKGWVKTLFSGRYDLAFAESRWLVGRRHVEIDLPQSYAMGALARLRCAINRSLTSAQSGEASCPAACLIAVNKLLDIDAAIIEFAYQEHFSRRLRAAADEQLRHHTRLASIGQMVTGLAHESRNALQRSGACLEALLLEIEDRPLARQQALRIQSALDHLHILYEEVRNYAAPLRLDLEAVSLHDRVRQAWQSLRPLWRGAEIQVGCHKTPGPDVMVSADVHRLDQVLANLLENAIQAVGPSGTIECRIERNGNMAKLSVLDSGPGISDANADRIFDPFFTTKPKGTGLGLAITRRIVDAHGGTISAGRSPLGGAALEVTFPLAGPDDFAAGPEQPTGNPSLAVPD
jgi:signal transduction histidine kinase